MRLETVSGPALEAVLPDLARLRIAVFREYPYLYDGTEEYEARYLRTYVASGEAMAVLAIAEEQIVGASTGVPMRHESDEFRRPLETIGIDPAGVFYCGESVLLPAWRGQGIYRAFFAQREHHARSIPGLSWIAFCAVQRPAEHPLRPPEWQSLDAVWRHFGYTREPRLVTHYDWKDIDQSVATAHPMQFWLKKL